MNRHDFERDGLRLSYLDAGGAGSVLIALHSHWLEGQTFAPLALVLAPEWRVVALDQRGHGYSGHATTYTREDYLEDLSALYAHLGLSKAVILGNSLGGVNAYQFAARHPDRVSALIIEDIGAEIGDDTSFALPWAGTFRTKEELAERIGPRFLPYLEESIRKTADGWRLAFEPRDMVMSQQYVNGDHWADWLATDCPALLLRGQQSRVTSQEHLEKMAMRRPNTQFMRLEGGHVLHKDNPVAFTEAARTFLAGLPREQIGK
jgi:esterase